MKNRKKSDTYRFNGYTGIEPVLIDELKRWIHQYRSKLRWRKDSDARKWTMRWLKRFEREMGKKLRGRERKGDERAKDRRMERLATNRSDLPDF